jgi:parallel beta-helix repeat protein
MIARILGLFLGFLITPAFAIMQGMPFGSTIAVVPHYCNIGQSITLPTWTNDLLPYTGSHSNFYISNVGSSDTYNCASRVFSSGSNGPCASLAHVLSISAPGDNITYVYSGTTYAPQTVPGGTNGSPGKPFTISGECSGGGTSCAQNAMTQMRPCLNGNPCNMGFYLQGAADGLPTSSYIVFENFDMSSGNGANGGSVGWWVRGNAHHIAFFNNNIHDNGEAGIQTTDADYIFIQGNTVSGNAQQNTSSCYSGISLHEMKDTDNAIGIKAVINRNNIYLNTNTPGGVACSTAPQVTDGSGIILDNANHSQEGSNTGICCNHTTTPYSITSATWAGGNATFTVNCAGCQPKYIATGNTAANGTYPFGNSTIIVTGGGTVTSGTYKATSTTTTTITVTGYPAGSGSCASNCGTIAVTFVPYQGTFLIQNNLIWGNGGRGISHGNSGNLIAVSNTLYENSQLSAAGNEGSFHPGEIGMDGPYGTNLVYNNVVYSAGFVDGANGHTVCWHVGTSVAGSTVIFDNNDCYVNGHGTGGSGIEYYFFSNSGTVTLGGSSIYGDPVFNTPNLTPGSNNFHVQATSPSLIANGANSISSYIPLLDYSLVQRGDTCTTTCNFNLGAYNSISN